MSLRRLAFETLMDITERGAYANLRLKTAQAGLPVRDAKWLAALVYETLDHLYYLDYVLVFYARGRLQAPVRGVLRLGVCELLFMRTPQSAACDESVKLVKEIGKQKLAGYVNGVLRTIAREKDNPPPLPEEPIERLRVQYSWPGWLIEQWVDRFGVEQAELLLRTHAPGMQLRAQPPFTTKELKQALENRGLDYIQGKWMPDCLRLNEGINIAEEALFVEGKLTVQSEGSMLVCAACKVGPKMRVLDVCAAPGGKSAYLYALGGEDIELHSWELHPHRKALLDKTLARLNVSAQTKMQDATVLQEEYRGYFDVVLLDVPCSGLGVAAGKPDIRYQKSPEAIEDLVKIQRNILDTCCEYVRPGGALIYASCTISERENEQQVNEFLSRRADFAPDDLSGALHDELLEKENWQVQLLPHLHGTEGFFVARMKKKL
ncbi:16S rRNA (cytosine(967)-C(5))-methyltransferase RsmB [Eubacteriales bacterium OttesenSCG-928-K08]|nr:16S rRNA (cytosine(967)-C(5))-methyltransferase RsmB [Eubacteriales bacterium OttesenSCG-928-K08]